MHRTVTSVKPHKFTLPSSRWVLSNTNFKIVFSRLCESSCLMWNRWKRQNLDVSLMVKTTVGVVLLQCKQFNNTHRRRTMAPSLNLINSFLCWHLLTNSLLKQGNKCYCFGNWESSSSCNWNTIAVWKLSSLPVQFSVNYAIKNVIVSFISVLPNVTFRTGQFA